MGQEWIIVLRAVNVAGQGKLPMAPFREVLSRMFALIFKLESPCFFATDSIEIRKED